MDARSHDRTRAGRVAGVYLAASVAWILVSDRALAAAGLDPDRHAQLQTAKGVTFVALTAGLLYWLVGRELRASGRAADLLRAVVAGTTDGVFVKDRDGRYLLCNPAAAGFLGRTPDEVVGRADVSFLTPGDGRRVRESDEQVMAGGEAETFEQTVTLGGAVRTFRATKAPYRDAAGAVVGVLGISRDVTDLKRREEQYRQAAKLEAVGRLAGGIAHDFNNVLTAVTGCADLLRGMPLGDEAGELVEEIREAGGRAAGLTRQLLTFARPSPAVTQVVDPNAVVGGLERMLRRVLGTGVEVAAELRPAGHVLSDPGQLEQVLMNLALNARDAMPAGGRLTIETGVAAGGYTRLSVSDTGHGIPPAVLPHVFEPFFTTKADKGTGLGLAMVHGLVKQAGGHIEVESTVGAGTTFAVYLPQVTET